MGKLVVRRTPVKVPRDGQTYSIAMELSEALGIHSVRSLNFDMVEVISLRFYPTSNKEREFFGMPQMSEEDEAFALITAQLGDVMFEEAAGNHPIDEEDPG